MEEKEKQVKQFYYPIKDRVALGEVLLSDIVEYYYSCRCFRKTAKYFHTREDSIKALFIKNNITFYEGKFNSIDNQILRLPVNDIIKFYLDSKSKNKTINKFNITIKVLNKILEKANIVSFRKTIKDLLREDPEIEQKVVALYLAPETLTYVAAKFSIAPYIVKNILNKFNIHEHSKEVNEACRQKHRRETCIELYGVDNATKSEIIKEKVKCTCQERYGADNPFKSEEIKEKIKQTNLEKYGCENPSQAEEIKRKKEKTCKEHYGTNYFIQSEVGKEAIKKTCQEKYGYESTFQVPEIKEKIFESNLKKYGNKCSLHGEEIAEKVKKTFKEKYGTEYYVQSNDFKEKYLNTCQTKYNVINVSQIQEVKDKKINTMRSNRTFNISQPEEDFYNNLIQLFSKEDIVRQYNTRLFENSDRYPFACDFYIKSLDLFIELNLSWTHGFHEYNKDSLKDQQILNEWLEKSKTSEYYKNAIVVWTIRDPLKIKTAKENNLNYRMVYNLKKLNELLEELKLAI